MWMPSIESLTTAASSRSNSIQCCAQWPKIHSLTGSIVAIVTPMHNDNDKSVDYEALRRLISWQISKGTKGIVVMGTTGENPTVDENEYEKVVRFVVLATKELAHDMIPVIAGTGTNNTMTTILRTQTAEWLGADAALIVTPYYNKPTQEGLIQHYATIARACPNFPIILYNVPSRTGCDMFPSTTARLSTIPNIVGIKEASGKLERYGALTALCDAEFKIFSGEDSQAVQAILSGAKGVISVAANVCPDLVQKACELASENDGDAAQLLDQQLQQLYQALFVEPNPCPVKYILAAEGRIPCGIRLPLLPLSEKHQSHVYELYKLTVAEALRHLAKD